MGESSFNFMLVALTGLLGAPHCIGMCGGIMSAWTLNSNAPLLQTVLAYNLGRITTYTVVGGFMGFVGSFVEGAGKIVGLQGIASMLGGLFILLWIFKKYALPIVHWTPVKLPVFRKFLERSRSRSGISSIFLSGVLLGFLPCGLSYAMQMQAAGSGEMSTGALTMAFFGLGTLPGLLLIGFFAAIVGQAFRSKAQMVANVLAVAIGVLSILRGMVVNGWIPTVNPWLW